MNYNSDARVSNKNSIVSSQEDSHEKTTQGPMALSLKNRESPFRYNKG